MAKGRAKESRFCSRKCQFAQWRDDADARGKTRACPEIGCKKRHSNTHYVECVDHRNVLRPGRPCDICQSPVNGYKAKYCSPACYRKGPGRKARNARVKAEARRVANCRGCGSQFTYKAGALKFHCNRACYERSLPGKQAYVCSGCGVATERFPSTAQSKKLFCSLECRKVQPGSECVRGHKIEGSNLRIDYLGRKRCRQCQLAWSRKNGAIVLARVRAERAKRPAPTYDCVGCGQTFERRPLARTKYCVNCKRDQQKVYKATYKAKKARLEAEAAL